MLQLRALIAHVPLQVSLGMVDVDPDRDCNWLRMRMRTWWIHRRTTNAVRIEFEVYKNSKYAQV